MKKISMLAITVVCMWVIICIITGGCENVSDNETSTTTTTIPTIPTTTTSIVDECVDNIVGTWEPISTQDALEVRSGETIVWTGSSMIVWGGLLREYGVTNTGNIYDPAIDEWVQTSIANDLYGRSGHTAIWTGTNMIVWGGGNEFSDYIGPWDQGGIYDPAFDSWTLMTTENAPEGRYLHVAVWADDKMIVWGGGNEYTDLFPSLNTGGIYNPVLDLWTATSVTGAPSRLPSPVAVWTGSEMIIWFGDPIAGAYNPDTDAWRPISTTGAPEGRYGHTAVWTGNEMIIWGGRLGDEHLNTGGRYNPKTDSWELISMDGVPSPRRDHTAVWTGSRMIIWGGSSGIWQFENDGGIYDPSTDKWTCISSENAPTARVLHNAVWTGSGMIIWGGINDEGWQITGAIFYPME